MDKSNIPSYKDIESAHRKIAHNIHQTPVMTCSAINGLAGASLFFKCENFQKAGAFKFRGASNAVLSLSDEDARKGVATHSSGNHAAALAFAAKLRGIPAYIAMPETAPAIKKKAVAGYGAKIRFCQPTVESREDTLQEIIEETGATFIHAYNDFNIISGQGTAVKELMSQVKDLDVIVAPVGGGGLLSGTAIWAKHVNSGIRVIAGEPEKADDAYRSFKTGVLQPGVPPGSIADGLLMPLSNLTFSIVREYVDEIVTVSEESIVSAMQLIWERMKIIAEPSSAVALAAVFRKKDELKSARTGIILSGGNVDLKKLPF